MVAIATLLVALVGMLRTSGPAHANAAYPSWWSGNCDVNNHPGSYPLGASYNGVEACGPGPLQGGYDHWVYFFPHAWGEKEWECVELVMRYMYLVYGIAPYSANGSQVVWNYSGSFLTKVANNGASLPSPGDIISEGATSAFGHTAIVTQVTVSNGRGAITAMEQNNNTNGWDTISVTGNVLGSGVTGWLHAPANWIPITGDWDGNGTVTIGSYDPNTATFYLRNSNTTGVSDIAFVYGNPGWVPITGDWDGSGKTSVGVYNPSTATFYLRGDTSPVENTIAAFVYGNGGSWVPITGDWDGNKTTTIGVYNPSTATFYLRNSNTTGVSDIAFQYGNPD